MSVAEVYTRPGAARPVLIVEDERKMRRRLIEQFERLEVEVIEAASGFAAIRAAAEKRPGLILLDGLLPEMHGFEVSRVIRRLDPGYRPRIVLMTGIYKNVRYHNEAMLRYGVDEYVIKPLGDDVPARLLGYGDQWGGAR
jgi:DNA-binding response OmpR family regulator